MSRADLFWDRIAEKYSKRPIADEAAYQKKLRITQGYFRPDMKVLEFGCGTGGTAIIHAPHVKHVHAIDISDNMLQIARRRAAAKNVDNVTFEHATIEEFSAPDHSFDAVLGLSILHLLRDKEAAIAKVHRMLKPGGVFVTSTVCLGGSIKMWPFRLVLPIGQLFGRLPHLSFFTVEQLIDSLTRAGFEIDHEWQPKPKTSAFLVAKA